MAEIQNNDSKVVFRMSITLGLILAVASGIWWAAAFTQEVITMQSDVLKNRRFSEEMGIQVFRLREHAAADIVMEKAVERRLDSIDNTLRRIEGKLDQVNRRSNQQ